VGTAARQGKGSGESPSGSPLHYSWWSVTPEEIATKHGIAPDWVIRRLNTIMRRERLREFDSARLRRLRRNPRRSVHRDHIECLVCGSRTRNLVDHVRGHRLTLRGYLRRYRLKRAEVPVLVFNQLG